LITFHSYASWLHGDAKGSVDREHGTPGEPFVAQDKVRVEAMRRRQSRPATLLDRPSRGVVEDALREVCAYRGWHLLALNVRTSHVHAVVKASATPEKVMNDLKARATKRLREADLVGPDAKVWSRHGSTRYLWDERSVESACRYVTEGQGIDLD
jgi:REP element-mobilizing transposase RayT